MLVPPRISRIALFSVLPFSTVQVPMELNAFPVLFPKELYPPSITIVPSATTKAPRNPCVGASPFELKTRRFLSLFVKLPLAPPTPACPPKLFRAPLKYTVPGPVFTNAPPFCTKLFVMCNSSCTSRTVALVLLAAYSLVTTAPSTPDARRVPAPRTMGPDAPMLERPLAMSPSGTTSVPELTVVLPV